LIRDQLLIRDARLLIWRLIGYESEITNPESTTIQQSEIARSTIRYRVGVGPQLPVQGGRVT